MRSLFPHLMHFSCTEIIWGQVWGLLCSGNVGDLMCIKHQLILQGPLEQPLGKEQTFPKHWSFVPRGSQHPVGAESCAAVSAREAGQQFQPAPEQVGVAGTLLASLSTLDFLLASQGSVIPFKCLEMVFSWKPGCVFGTWDVLVSSFLQESVH